MPMFSPYVYLFPLQQYSTMQMKPHAPSSHYPCSSPPTKLQDPYQPNPYPVPSSSPQYDHHSPPAEPLRPAETQFNQNPYPPVSQPLQRMPCASLPWPPPRNPPPCPVGYSSPPPPYSNAPPSSQGYHPGQATVHQLYPYPPFSLGYQPPSAPEELQVSQAALEQLQPANSDPIHSHGHVRVLGPLEAPPTASMANANSNRSIVVTTNYGKWLLFSAPADDSSFTASTPGGANV